MIKEDGGGPTLGHRAEPEEEDFNFGLYLSMLYDSRWLVGSLCLAGLVTGILVALLARPVYRADALVQVEPKQSALAGLQEMTSPFEGSSPADSEVEIIRSRSILGPVVDQLGLQIEVEPEYLPVLGEGIARRRGSQALASPLLGSFAWGGELLKIDRLKVPAELENEPLTLRAEGSNEYVLLAPGGEELLRGTVGAASTSSGQVELFVSQLRARPGTAFRVKKLPRGDAISALQRELGIKERGAKTGIIGLSLDGHDPQLLVQILDAVTQTYLRQNVERKSEEASKTLAFLEQQLPVLRAQLDTAESALNAHRSRAGSVDVGLETKAAIEQVVEIEAQLTRLTLERSELQQRFTAEHPSFVALNEKIARLQRERSSANARMKGLPSGELKSAGLMRDVKVSNELYLLLLNKAQELRVIKSGTVGNVRILDTALVARKPVKPTKGPIIAVSMMLGLVFGVLVALLKKSLSKGVVDPMLIEQEIGLSVYASVPLSPRQSIRMSSLGRGRAPKQQPLLAQVDPADLSVESLRSLRTSLQFALMEARNNVVAIGGPSPGVGKSFVASNLAHVLAEGGRSVILVDADLRRGKLHEAFGLPRGAGLSDIVNGTAEVSECIRQVAGTRLSLLSTGVILPNPSELLLSQRYRALIESLSSQYDLVVLDTAPILAVTDGALAAQVAGVNLFVIRSGVHPLREISTALRRLQQGGIRVNGVVFNAVDRNRRPGGLGQYDYHYQYEYKSTGTDG